MFHIDDAVSKVQRAVTMKRVTQSTVQATKALYQALSALHLQKVLAVINSRLYRIWIYTQRSCELGFHD